MFALLVAASLLSAAAAPAPAAAAPAKAPDPAKAKELFNAGKKLYDQGKYGEAVVKFEEAFAARPHPIIYFNIGKCYELMGDSGKGETGKGLRAYRDYLRALPDASDKQAVQDSIANLERKLKEKGLQQVLVFAEPATARIEIDGKDIGVQPASTELKPGEHKLVAKADGHETLERTFTMSAVRSQEVTVTLKAGTPGIPPSDAPKNDDLKQPTANNGTGSAVTPNGSGTTTTTSANPEVTKRPPPPVAKKGRLFTWIAAGGAVVAGGVGAGLGVVAGGADSKLHDKTAASTRTRAEADQLVATAGSMSLGANVCYGVAGAAAVTAVILFFVEGK